MSNSDGWAFTEKHFFVLGLILQTSQKIQKKWAFLDIKPNKSRNKKPTLGYIERLAVATDTKTSNPFIPVK